MSGLIRVVPEALDLDPAIRQGRIESFDAYLGALKDVEADAKRKHEAKMQGKYAEWSGLLQMVKSQFKLIAGVFRQIEDSTDSWIVTPHQGEVWSNISKNGYTFSVSLKGYNHVRVEDGPRRFDRREPYKVLKFTWGKSLGIHGADYPSLDGKDRSWGLGDETHDLGLPQFFAIEHTTLDDATLMAKAQEYIESGEYRDTKWKLKEKIRLGHYSLNEFYRSEWNLDRLLDDARNNLVVVTVKHKGKEAREGIEVGLFGEYDVEHVVRGMFVAMTKGEFPSTTDYLS